LHDLGIRTIGDLTARPEQLLVSRFGESGRHIWQLACGLDDRQVWVTTINLQHSTCHAQLAE